MSKVKILEESEYASSLKISKGPHKSPRHLTRHEEAESTSPLNIRKSSRTSPLHLKM